MLYQLSVDNQKDILAAGKGDKAAEARVIARQDAAIAVTAVAAGGYALVYGGQILIAASAEMATAGRVALEGCKTNPALCLNNVGIFVADAIAPEAAVGTGVLVSNSVLILDKSKESASALTKALNESASVLSKTGKFEEKAVAQIIQAEMKSDVLSKSTLDALQTVQKIHKEDILNIFDRNNTESDLMVFGQKFKQVLGEGGSNKAGNVKVFATEKLTEQNIRAYAESLTGGVPFTEIPNKLGRYYAKLANGSTVNLRKVSTSADRTKARWTIEIIGDEQIGKLQDKVKKPVEIKFQ
ncbi:hypothetical protein C5472_14505 [Photorhabdus sp. RW14-46]|nr:hypothetical protein [Photorhabdus sp. RW14-46]